jgi:hypothetical protein
MKNFQNSNNVTTAQKYFNNYTNRGKMNNTNGGKINNNTNGGKMNNTNDKINKEYTDFFRGLKLSYENIIYKKVLHCDYIVAIPKGKKCFIWFHNESDDRNVCSVIYINEHTYISKDKIVCFDTSLCYGGLEGTILYGTTFKLLENDCIFFSVEDVFYYQGKNVSFINWETKLSYIHQMMMKEIKQIGYNKNFMVIGLPIMTTNFQEIVTIINEKEIPYEIDCFQYKKYLSIKSFLTTPYSYIKDNLIGYSKNIIHVPNIEEIQKNNGFNHYPKKEHVTIRSSKNPKTATFLVKADLSSDIYHLHHPNNANMKSTIACIPDYKTSVFMNGIFRNIKENKNLDSLEESDDEDEKPMEYFVDTKKEVKMQCQYHPKWKKWIPLYVNE